MILDPSRLDVGTRVLARVRELQHLAPDVGLEAHLRKATDETIAELTRDAERWRALIGSQRIRIIGTARLGTPEGHIALEAWGRYPGVNAERQECAVRQLTAYADGLREGRS